MRVVHSLSVRTIIIKIFFVSVITTLNLTLALENINKQSETCGRLTPIQNDVRTLVPWTIGVFDVSNLSQKNGQPRFLTSGFIISPTLVVSVLGGPSGLALQSLKKPPKFPPPTTHLLIGAGINTTDFSRHDQHAQYSRVSFIEPFRDFDPTNVYNHRVLYHLKTPLNLTTPYVHEVCLSLYFTRKGFAYANPSSFGWDMVHSGFAKKAQNSVDHPWILTAWKARHGPNRLCQSHFRFYYQRPVLNLCATRNLDGNSTTDISYTNILDYVPKMESTDYDLDLCQSHGSVVSHAVGKTWFAASTVTLIPAKRRGRCTQKSVYTMAPLNFPVWVKFLEWLYFAYKCPHNTFSCGGGGGGGGPDSKCIPLSAICDDRFDCTDHADEHYSLCGSEKTAVMDPSIDFRIGGFSDNERCPLLPILLTMTGTTISCTDTLANDVKVDCDSATFYGARIKVKCDDYHNAPRFAYQSLDLQCSLDGRWTGLRPFHCEQVCGQIVESEKISKNFQFPWTATIVRENQVVCGATLIDQSFLLTAASCVFDWPKKLEERSNFEVALYPFSKISSNEFVQNFTQSGHRFQMKNVWLSPFAGLGLVQLQTVAEINGQDKPMAACYLQRPFGVPHAVGEFGHFISQEKWNKNKMLTSSWSGQVVARELCGSHENGEKIENILCIQTDQDKNPLMGSGLFIPMVDPGGKTVQVLKGVFANKMKNGMLRFENVDSQADWILDTLEAHS